jgi:integrase
VRQTFLAAGVEVSDVQRLSASVVSADGRAYVVQVLRRPLERQENWKAEAGEVYQALGYVFTTQIGTPIDPRNCTRVVQKACDRAGVRVVRLHDFRHGCISVRAASRAESGSEQFTPETQNRSSDDVCQRLMHCAPVGIRTPNLLIRSQMLYPLSYRRTSRGLHEDSGRRRQIRNQPSGRQ